MSSYLLAKGVGKSLNEDSYEVRIIRTAAGSNQTTEFTLAANGFDLKYESVDDSALVPGIMHSRCEVTTLWPADIHAKLNLLLTALATSTDGDYLLEVLRDSTRIWVGSILVEEFEVNEDSTNKEVTIVATDGLSLLRHVDYNNSGTAYTGYQTVYDIVKNIQEKWSLYTYLNAQNSGTEYRLAWAEDVYSEDDYIMAAETHPAGTDLKSIERSRIHTNPWSSVNSSGATEYISCYDLLQSLCITYQWRLYSYGDAWHMLPVALAGERTPGTVLQWNGTEVDRDVITEYQFQKDAANDVRQKGAAWRISYTPPHNEVRVTRDTNDGATVISNFNFAAGTALADGDVVYPGIDTENSSVFYEMRGRFKFSQSAQSVAQSSIAELMLRFTIAWGDSSTQYYVNNLADGSGLAQSVAVLFGAAECTFLTAVDPAYSGSAGYFYYKAPQDNGVYDVNQDIERFIDFVFIVPPPQTQKTGLTVTPDFLVFDANAGANNGYKAALTTTFVDFKVSKFSGDLLEFIPDFDIVANATTGRGALELGTTNVGQLGTSMGRIDVQTSAGVYGTTSNWVCKDNDTTRAINTLLVQETLARHNKPKGLERGSIVLRGTSAAVPSPFNFYKDLDTATSYAPVNWQLNATACELDLTLRKTGRDAISMTTHDENTGKGPDRPIGGSTGQEPVTALPNTRGFNTQAATKFAEDWSAVIGSETLEAYYTVLPDGTGRRVNNQGDTPTAGTDISRKIYFRLLGLHGAADGGWLALPVNQPALNDTLATAFDKIDLYMAALATSTAGAYSFIVTYSEVSDRVLDNYAGGQAAFSLRKLRAGYTGNCIKVRRSSDNTTQDIGFSGTDLDAAALLTFCGGGDGFVHTWFDQSTAGRNAVNTSTGEQPQIVNSGSVIQVNGKPAVEFDGSNDTLLTSAFAPNPSGAYNLAVVHEHNVVNVGQQPATSWSSTQSQQNFICVMMASAKVRLAVRYSNNNLPRPDSTATFTAGTQIISTGTFANGSCEAYYNGTNELDKFSANVNANPNNSSRAMALGTRSDNGGSPLRGTLQEFIVFSNGTAHDAEDLSDELNTHYSAF